MESTPLICHSSEEVSVLEHSAKNVGEQDEVINMHGNPFKLLQAIVVHLDKLLQSRCYRKVNSTMRDPITVRCSYIARIHRCASHSK